MSATNVPVSEELSKALQSATNPSDIRELIIAEAEKQATAAAEKAAADTLAKATADAAKAAADADPNKPVQVITRTETIGGKEFTFEAETEIELERMVNNAYKVAEAVKAPEPVADPAQEEADRKAAEQTAADRAVAIADLEMKFKRGEITATDYIEQSGAIDQYLEKKGIPVSELQASVEANRSQGYVKSWEDATTTFLNSPAGSDWPGGEKNKTLLGWKLAELGLVEAEDKVAAMARAYSELKSSGMLFASDMAAPAAPVAPAVPEAQTAASATPKAPATPPAAPPAPKVAPTSSSMFGRSSGVAPNTAAPAPTNTAPKVELPKDATPQEILAAYKEGLIAQGIDPNKAFVDTYASRR